MIDRAANALYEAVKAARDAGLKVYVHIPDNADGHLDFEALTVERPIPLPSDEREAEDDAG